MSLLRRLNEWDSAAGIKYFSAYMQANRIIDATVSLRLGITETPDKPSPE